MESNKPRIDATDDAVLRRRARKGVTEKTPEYNDGESGRLGKVGGKSRRRRDKPRGNFIAAQTYSSLSLRYAIEQGGKKHFAIDEPVSDGEIWLKQRLGASPRGFARGQLR